jgi:hypothetical protein
MKSPKNQDILIEHMNIISNNNFISKDLSSNEQARYLSSNVSQSSSRRSKNALLKVSRMKKAYSVTRSETLPTAENKNKQNSNSKTESLKVVEDFDDIFDDEVKNLYMWTKNLSINEF